MEKYQEFLNKINVEFEKKGFVFFQKIEDLEHVKYYHLEDSVFFGREDKQARTSRQHILIKKLDLDWSIRYPSQYLMIRKRYLEHFINYTETKKEGSSMWEELKQDEGFQIAVQANIAMAFKDSANLWKSKKQSHELTSEDLHIIASAAASYFVDLVCGQNPFNVEGDGAFKNVAVLSEYLKREQDYLKQSAQIIKTKKEGK